MVQRAFGTPHRAGLMSHSVGWLSSTPRPRRGLPLWLRTPSRVRVPLFLSLAPCTSHRRAPSRPSSSVPFALSRSLLPLSLPLFLPVRSPISFTLAQRPFFHPLAPGVPLLSSAMSTSAEPILRDSTGGPYYLRLSINWDRRRPKKSFVGSATFGEQQSSLVIVRLLLKQKHFCIDRVSHKHSARTSST